MFLYPIPKGRRISFLPSPFGENAVGTNTADWLTTQTFTLSSPSHWKGLTICTLYPNLPVSGYVPTGFPIFGLLRLVAGVQVYWPPPVALKLMLSPFTIIVSLPAKAESSLLIYLLPLYPGNLADSY